MSENVHDGDEREGRVVARIPADSFGHRLMLSRSHAGNLTIEDAAKRCGFSRQAWTNWERGARPRDLLDVVDQVAEHLQIDHDWLLYGGPLAPAPRPRRVRVAYARRSLR